MSGRLDLIEPRILKSLLIYEPLTGKLFWRSRTANFFAKERDCDAWNARYAGAEAFTSLNNCGYFKGGVLGQDHLAHRVIWALVTEAWPKDFIDHMDKDRKNNRWINLREATRSQNNSNKTSLPGSSSKFLGVFWNAPTGKWLARIRIKGRSTYLGQFSEEIDAAIAYDAAARQHHGEFANPNFPLGILS